MSGAQPYPAPGPPRRRWVLFMMFFVALFNYLDRNVLAVLLEDIKADLGASDWQMGLLSGLAFAVVFSTLAFPVARLADRTSRVAVLAAATAIWSAMTALCGLAGNCGQLLLARVGVAAGEAGGAPPAHALIAAHYPAEKRAGALAVFALGGALGTTLGYAVAGAINKAYDWRTAFIAVGLPGLLVAALVLLTVRDPSQGRTSEQPSAVHAGTLWSDVSELLARRSFSFVVAGFAIAAIAGVGAIAWLPAFYQRMHGLDSEQAGIGLLAANGLPSMVGLLAGGVVGDALFRRDRRWAAWLPALGLAISVPLTFGLLFASSAGASFAFMVGPALLTGLYVSPSFAVIQSLAEPRRRATAAALASFCVTMVGAGLGPFLIGALSDALAPFFGGQSLRWAMAIVAGTYLIGAIAFWLGARTMAGDLDAAARGDPAPAEA